MYGGVTPVAALVTIALPRDFDSHFVAAIYDGMNALARRRRLPLFG